MSSTLIQAQRNIWPNTIKIHHIFYNVKFAPQKKCFWEDHVTLIMKFEDNEP
jgi:hypothetical protein